jgi:UDP-2,4-diacetamido-2,4,6-trideoxy-beta-L-altropyranose hydrolase
MEILIRTDASLQSGTGHIMRCLTLAEALRQRGAVCHFVCRAHPGNLIKLVQKRGFMVHSLQYDPTWQPSTFHTAHTEWLGADWEQDVEQTKVCLGGTAVDWLIVDHYALDARWELTLAKHCGKLMVIDDLADRPHACDLLLDQTFRRKEVDYLPLVPANCRLLCGSQYALLQPEFATMRSYSLHRRVWPAMRELLITMGGIDKDNVTGRVLQVLRNCSLPADCRITVVMGATAPWLNEVRAQAQDIPWSTRVLVEVSDMAQLMAESDLAIGAAGTTSWERCCLGLPTILLILAKNQLMVARGLEQVGAAILISSLSELDFKLMDQINSLFFNPEKLRSMCEASAEIVDGLGTNSVLAILESYSG